MKQAREKGNISGETKKRLKICVKRAFYKEK